MGETTATRAPGGGVRAVVVDLALNTLLPYGVYLGLRHVGQTETHAIITSAIVPAGMAVASLVIRRRMNFISLLVLGATGSSLLASAWSGSTWFALIRPSFITGLLSLVFAGSLALERPTMFYLARDTTCPTAAEAAAFDAYWSHAPFRAAMRKLTLVWAAFLGGEALFRAALAWVWPYPGLIAASQVLWVVLPMLLIRWSIRAGRRWATS
jgi:hypothetical protein